MTDQRKETIQALFAAIAAYDGDALSALCADEATLQVPRRPVYHGRKGALALINDLAGAFVDWKPCPIRVVSGDDVACVEWTATLTDFGGTQAQVDGCGVVDFQGGLIRRLRLYWRPEDQHS